MNGHFEENNGNKHLTLVPTNGREEKFKRHKEPWSKINDLIRSITTSSGYYDEKYMKINFNSYDELTLNKTIEVPSMAIVVRAAFYENNKYYLKVFLSECL